MASLGKDQWQAQIEIGLDALSAGEYDHFVRECLTKQEKREIEQIQQMFNLDDMNRN